MIFHHASRYQWHNDDPLYDGKRLLSQLRLSHVRKEGYVNLRCTWAPGCPFRTQPLIEAELAASLNHRATSGAVAGWYFKEAWEEIFPFVGVPEEVGIPCGGQFAATGAAIRKFSKKDYEYYRRWLLHNKFGDEIASRVIEYMWHSATLLDS